MGFAVALLLGCVCVLALPAAPTGAVLLSMGSVLGFALAVSIAIPSFAVARRDTGSPPAPHHLQTLLSQTSWRVVALGLTVGVLHTSIQAHLYLSNRWLSDKRAIADVVIDSIPTIQGNARTFDALVTLEGKTPLRGRLISRIPNFNPNAGDRWKLLLSLRPPEARVNPGAPDLERILFRDRIHAVGSVVDSSINHLIDAGHRPLESLREQIARHIDSRVTDRDAAALASALAVGVTGAMSREQWRVFNATGTTHLVAISGLHVTLFAVIAFAVARSIWSTVLYRFVPWSRENFAAVFGFTAATAYATLAGLSVPTQRTLIMLGVWLFVRAAARASPPFHSFALALALVLLWDPFAPLAAGFWLSFGAMAAIILVTSTRFARRPMLLEAIAVQAVVTIALIPLTLAAFGSVSLIGPLVNAIAIPVMSWLLVPTILLAVVLVPISPVASDFVLRIAEWLHGLGWPWLAAAADVPWALVHASPPVWWYVIAGMGMCVCLLPVPLPLRFAACVWMLPLSAATVPSQPDAAADVTILDVGEGTGIVVQTARHVLVFGTGDVYGTDGRTAESVVVPFLRSRGIRRIDALVAGRLTAAISPGVTALLAELPIEETWVAGDPPADLTGGRACDTPNSWNWDGVHFQFVGPCVLAIEAGVSRVLLPIETDASSEQILVTGTNVSAQLVVVPRQGSDTASSHNFVRAVSARWAVVSGRRERNGREKAALGRWHASGATVLATAESGAIAFRLDPSAGLSAPVTAREAGRTLWRGRLEAP